MTEQIGFGVPDLVGDFPHAAADGIHVFAETVVAGRRSGRQPVEKMHAYAVLHAQADRAHRWAQVPDVRTLDRRGYDQDGWPSRLAAVVTKAPKRTRGRNPIRTFVRTQAQCLEGVTLKATTQIAELELCLVESGQDWIHRQEVVHSRPRHLDVNIFRRPGLDLGACAELAGPMGRDHQATRSR